MSRRSKQSNKVIIGAIQRYAAGDLVADIAKDLGVHQPIISYWVRHFCKKLGLKEVKLRKGGRKPGTEPNERDKEFLYMSSLGQPAAHIAKENDLKRARVSYIIKLWKSRGYVPPPPPYRVGDVLSFAGNSIYRLEKITSTKGGVARLLREFIPPDKEKGETEGHWETVEGEVIVENFKFYRDQFAEVIQEAAL